MSTGSSTLELTAEPEMRGRVMWLWLVGFQDSTPSGAPIVGYTIAALGARAGLGLGALTCFIAAIAGHLALNRNSPRPRARRHPDSLIAISECLPPNTW
jgi:hypothetical protein